MRHINGHSVQQVADVCAFGVAWCTVFELLPPIAAALSIVWLLIQIGQWGWRTYKKCKAKSAD